MSRIVYRPFSHGSFPPLYVRHFFAQLSATRHGRVKTFFAHDVTDALAQIASEAMRVPHTTLLAVSWPVAANPQVAIARIVEALAGVAWARWPDWYGESAPFVYADVATGAASDFDHRTIGRLGLARPALNRTWALRAARACRRGKRPILDAFPPAVQVQQLMLAMAQPDLILMLVLEDESAPEAELLGFARTAAWAAGETGARVAAIVPARYREANELDAISYDAENLSDDPRAAKPVGSRKGESDALPLRARGAQQSAKTPTTSAASRPGAVLENDVPCGPVRQETRRGTPRRPNDEPLRLVLPPILGRPHPSSPGEQLLAEWLARDRELAPLFEFNQRIEASSAETFVVDLLWRAGKLTVEVDGYGWHSSPHAFAADRHRDYRLLCEGYRTLRLPHDEVMDDPALQCEKIRDVVRAIEKER